MTFFRFWATADQDLRGLILHMPTNKDVLFWSTSQRDAAFRALDRMPILSKSRIIFYPIFGINEPKIVTCLF